MVIFRLNFAIAIDKCGPKSPYRVSIGMIFYPEKIKIFWFLNHLAP